MLPSGGTAAPLAPAARLVLKTLVILSTQAQFRARVIGSEKMPRRCSSATASLDERVMSASRCFPEYERYTDT